VGNDQVREALFDGLFFPPNVSLVKDIPTTEVTTTLISPPDNYNSPGSSVTFSTNVTATGFNISNMTLYLHGSTQSTNSTIGLTGLYNSSSWIMGGLTDYIYMWNVLSCGTNATSYLCDWGTNRTLTVDTIPPVVNITYPINNSEIVTFTTPSNVSLNFTATDAGGLYSCWYNNGTANNTLTCGTNTSIILPGGYKTIYYYANDSLGHLASTQNTFLINYLRPIVNYSLTGVEGEVSTFYFNITANNLTQANASIYYNGTSYPMGIVSYDGLTGAFSKGITLPLLINDTIKQFNITYFANGIQYNTSTYNQTVYNIPPLNFSSGDNCTGDILYLFNLKDEENLSYISGDFEYNFYYGLSNSSLVRSFGKVIGSTNFSICFNSTVTPNLTIGSGEIFYTSDNYVERRYYIFDETVVNTSINFILYDLLETSQTSFKLEVEDNSLIPYDNIYTKLFRWYPDLNEYISVDTGKTDETGSTVIHVVDEDVDYRIGVYETNGTLIYLANPIRMVCLLSPCTYTLKISPTEVDYTSFLNIDYTLTFDEATGIWDFVYSDDSGKTSTMNLTVFRVTSTTTYPVCSKTISGPVGALSCNTSIYTTGILKAEVYRSASPPVILAQKVVQLIQSAFKGSSFGLWLSLLIAIPIIFLFSLVSPTGALIGGVIALLPALLFGSINIAIFGALAISAGIVSHFLKRVN